MSLLLQVHAQEAVARDMEVQASQHPVPARSPMLPELRTTAAQSTELPVPLATPRKPRDAVQQVMLEHIRAILQVEKAAPLSIDQQTTCPSSRVHSCKSSIMHAEGSTGRAALTAGQQLRYLIC